MTNEEKQASHQGTQFIRDLFVEFYSLYIAFFYFESTILDPFNDKFNCEGMNSLCYASWQLNIFFMHMVIFCENRKLGLNFLLIFRN
jgi:hypothetical protein